MHFTQCISMYAFHSKHFTLCISPCTSPYPFHFMYFATNFILCISLNALYFAFHSMHSTLHFTLWISLYALNSCNLTLCISIYAFYSMHFTLCTSLYALHSMHFTLCTSRYALFYALHAINFTLCSSLYNSVQIFEPFRDWNPHFFGKISLRWFFFIKYFRKQIGSIVYDQIPHQKVVVAKFEFLWKSAYLTPLKMGFSDLNGQ